MSLKKTVLGMTEVGEPLISLAIEAHHAYREAVELARPAHEIERLCLKAELNGG